MTLDVMSVLDDGSVGPHRVSLSMQSHYELISSAERDGRCPLTLRARDYWGGDEVHYPADEAAGLLGELRRLTSATSHPELHELVAICDAAVVAHLGLLVVPD